MKKLLLVLAGLFVASTNAFAIEDYPDATLDAVMAMKADAEVKKEMPVTVAGAKVIDTAEAFKLLKEKKAIFLDNRVKTQFDTERISGAKWFFCDDLLKDPGLAAALDKEKEYVLYCNGPTCWRSPAAALMMSNLGFKNLYWYRDGLPAWKKKGHPVE